MPVAVAVVAAVAAVVAAAAAAPPFRIATVVWAMAVAAGAARWGRSRALAVEPARARARTNVLIRRHVKRGGARRGQGERHTQNRQACKLMHS